MNLRIGSAEPVTRRAFGAPAAALALAVLAPRAAEAFCGFYIAGAETRLLNEATVVALVRDGTHTVLSMQNHYRGPPDGFALVVPVPVVLKQEDVKTLPRDVFDHLDKLTAPRLVEYWEQDPCPQGADGGGVLMPGWAGGGLALGGHAGAGGMGSEVRVEARFAVGEYEVVVLSAGDSLALTEWLAGHGYRIPRDAAAALRPYVEGGMKFFVARVDPAKVTFRDGAAVLSPLRVAYDAETFTLPVRLGLLSSPGTQDLVVHVIAPDQRYEVANRANLTIPTNVDVVGEVRDRFGAFYAALFDKTVAGAPGAAVTEYAWSSASCDPCPAPPLSDVDLATLGAEPRRADLTSIRGPVGSASLETPTISGGAVANAPSVVAGMTAGFRRCYNKSLQEDPNIKGSVRVTAKIGPNGEVISVSPSGSGLSGMLLSCVAARVSSAQFAPPEGGSATVVIPAKFDVGPTAQPRPASHASPRPLYTVPRSFAITRLHLRYDRDTLGEDLVFKAAPPIAGGGEERAGQQDTVPSYENLFQARYVIRHPWEGPITCAQPRRGRWGPPPGGREDAAPRTAPDLAFAPRGGVDLASLVRADVPAVGLQRPAPPPDAGPPPAAGGGTPSRGCGACAAGPDAASGEGALALALAALAARRRRLKAR